MRSSDIVIGQEYEVTRQSNPDPRGYPCRFEQSRVRVVSISSGRFLCEYLDNPYSFSIRYRPRSGTRISLTARSLLRPWQEVVDEREEDMLRTELHDDSMRIAEEAALRLVKSMPELEIESCEAIRLDSAPDGSPSPVLEIRLPLHALAGIAVSGSDSIQESSLAELV